MANYETNNEPSREQLVANIIETATNEEYDIYAGGQGPLTLDQLDPELVTDDALQRVVERVGWPTERDAIMGPVHKYHSSSDFVEGLRTRSHPYFLNNFNTLLKVEPAENFDPQGPDGMEGIYGVLPVVQRANVLAPELFSSVREIFRAYKDISQQEELKAILEDDVVANQVWKAFKITGRLVTTDDVTIHKRILSSTVPSEAAPIKNIQDYLYL